MKRNLVRSCSIFIAILLFLFSFSSCVPKSSAKPDNQFYKKFSLKSNAIISPEALQKDKANYVGHVDDSFKIHFEKPTTVNTIVLSEKGDEILSFEISYYNPETKEMETIYKQDKVGSFRYCAFPEIETTDIEVKILKTKAEEFKLNEIDVLYATTNRKDLRVSSYVIVDTALDKKRLDAKHFETITDILLFSALRFDEQGNIVENELTFGDKKIKGKEAIKIALENIKSICGEKEPTIYLNLLGPDGDVNTKEEKHNIVFDEYADKFIANLVELTEEFNIDGISFDYEYPYKSKGWKTYSDFLVNLKNQLPEGKKIAIAVGPWGKTLTKKAQKCVDVLEVMTYDLFDDDGYHATFQGAVDGMHYMTKTGYSLSQCDLGLPFYGRPTGRYAFWPSYSDVYEQMGKFQNVVPMDAKVKVNEDGKEIEKEVGDNYYNSYQMIYDKTAYALDYGVGGLMIWHYACDVPVDTGLSLFDAIHQALLDRTI